MKQHIFYVFFAASSLTTNAQESNIFDGRNWGIVLDHPAMKNVTVQRDVAYLSDAKGTVAIDIYTPPGISDGENRPAVIFLNAIGENPGQRKVKSWGTYTTWPQLVAANGYIGISMETDGTRIPDCLEALFIFLDTRGKNFHIDAGKLGVYAASANVSQSSLYLMKSDAYKGIKAAVLYYGNVPNGPYRKDLPVLFVVAEGDVARNSYVTVWNEVLKNNAPWTIQMASNLVHGFDTFNDNDDSRKVIKETLSFWKNHLETIPSHPWPNSIGRQTLAAWYGRDNAKAASLLKDYIAANPTDTRPFEAYAHTLKDLQQFAEADVYYTKAMAIDPNNINMLGDIIVVKYGLKKDDEAKQMIAIAEKAGSTTRGFYASIGIALYIQNNHKEGIKFYEKAVTTSPFGWDYYNLACGYAILHDPDKAFKALDQALGMGIDSRQQFVNDPDLESLRSDPRYQKILTRLR